ncbi:hypothetical protein TW65_08587 [Stemphylium lycopersici]|uniref:Uncharacterized protein n=1 Tax=Stemphylium lycopersici TaxID=183478 RepID=A0A364NEK4_STELY|nr:hypothetical protein TW65_08587 [Stemphylium lycopersici]RAR15754.1 hypothetical protein DDE83_000769 [Stemphylium lycopersici]
MKFVASILLAVAVSAVQASSCNNGWGLPPNTNCPSSYPNSFCCTDRQTTEEFPHVRTCANVYKDNLIARYDCGSNGYIKCC